LGVLEVPKVISLQLPYLPIDRFKKMNYHPELVEGLTIHLPFSFLNLGFKPKVKEDTHSSKAQLIYVFHLLSSVPEPAEGEPA
jgi:hypothetical protein